mmetsp:Transcript_2833/g.11341  ORF Transcript_2833/g.11341 Transcript_2833/m.11341 type:complete len:279 (-) Transcript_2833:405-1241(-)
MHRMHDALGAVPAAVHGRARRHLGRAREQVHNRLVDRVVLVVIVVLVRFVGLALALRLALAFRVRRLALAFGLALGLALFGVALDLKPRPRRRPLHHVLKLGALGLGGRTRPVDLLPLATAPLVVVIAVATAALLLGLGGRSLGHGPAEVLEVQGQLVRVVLLVAPRARDLLRHEMLAVLGLERAIRGEHEVRRAQLVGVERLRRAVPQQHLRGAGRHVARDLAAPLDDGDGRAHDQRGVAHREGAGLALALALACKRPHEREHTGGCGGDRAYDRRL